MTERLEIYKCEICGNIVMVLHAGVGTLVCCGQPMKLQQANTVDASKEKHVPVVEKTAKGTLVKVGATPHPMEQKHYIEWIEADAGETVMLRFLKPGDKPEALFEAQVEVEKAREYCNIHGLWANKK